MWWIYFSASFALNFTGEGLKQLYTSYRLSSIHKKQDGFSQQKAIKTTKCIKFLWMNKITCDLKLDG